VDEGGTILYQNASAESLFGISRRQAAGQPVTTLAAGLEELPELVSRALQEGRSFGRDFELTLPKRDYRLIELGCRVAPFFEGRWLALLEFVDVTQSRQLDRERTLINQRLTSKRIILQLAHEIRNPLGGLRGAAQLLEKRLSDPALREYTQVIIGEADRLTALTEGLLGPRRRPVFAPLNIYEIIERVLLLVESDSPPGVTVVRDYDPSLPGVSVDRDQLIQALLNIMRNALQAIGSRGQLTIRTRALMNFVIGTEPHRMIASIEIEDSGPGIAPDIRESVFYPLVTDRDDGTGLGLVLAQEIIQRHGGLIEFDSEPGRTVFMVRLPLNARPVDDIDD